MTVEKKNSFFRISKGLQTGRKINQMWAFKNWRGALASLTPQPTD